MRKNSENSEAAPPPVIQIPPSPVVVSSSYTPPAAESDNQYGIDFVSVPDMGFTTVNGQRAVAEAIYRRFTTPRGLLAFHPDYGFDVRALLNESFDTQQLTTVKTALEREAQKDQRIRDINIGVDFNAQAFTLTLTFRITLATGPFSFVLTVSQLAVQMLFQGVS